MATRSRKKSCWASSAVLTKNFRLLELFQNFRDVVDVISRQLPDLGRKTSFTWVNKIPFIITRSGYKNNTFTRARFDILSLVSLFFQLHFLPPPTRLLTLSQSERYFSLWNSMHKHHNFHDEVRFSSSLAALVSAFAGSKLRESLFDICTIGVVWLVQAENQSSTMNEIRNSWLKKEKHSAHALQWNKGTSSWNYRAYRFYRTAEERKIQFRTGKYLIKSGS